MYKKLCKLIILLLCLSLCGCSTGEPDPNAGTYVCTQIVSDGVSMKPEELFEGGVVLKLLPEGKGSVMFGSEGGSVSWLLNGDELSLDINGQISYGTLKDGLISIDLHNSGTELIFALQGSQPAEKPATDSQGLSGGWYGWWRINKAEEGWADYENMWYDLCAHIEFDEDGEGRIKLWDEDYSSDRPMAVIRLELLEDGSAASRGGYFMEDAIEKDQWIIDLSGQSYEKLLSIESVYGDDKGSFEYQLFLRPWGYVWGDIEQENSELLPYYYHDWYLPLIEAGESMPDSIDT